MGEVVYLTANEILDKAKDDMVLLPSQESFRNNVATLLSMHLAKVKGMEEQGFKFNQLPSTFAFVVAPTGTGKSYILKTLAKASGMNISFINSTQITPTGYKGKNLPQQIKNIVESKNDFFDSCNVLVFDEYDKIFDGLHAKTMGYSSQPDFLKLFEGEDYELEDGKKISLDKTLIILSGACARAVEKKQEKIKRENSRIGFKNECDTLENINILESLTIDDLVEDGMLREIGSRVNTILHINPLTNEDYKILITDKSSVSTYGQFRNLFKLRGCKFNISRKAVEKITSEAIRRNVGLRSVPAIVSEQVMSAFSFLDSNEEFYKTALTTNENGDFRLVYNKGNRVYPKSEKIVVEPVTYMTYDISKEISTENSLNSFCKEFCDNANITKVKHYPIIYAFMQTACRYLKLEIETSKQKLGGILKLANFTKRDDKKFSSFEMACKNVVDQTEDKLFEHYANEIIEYLQQKEGASDIIRNTVDRGAKLYFERQNLSIEN